MSLLQAYDIEKYANTCANQVGLRVQWERVDSVPCTDGKTIFLPAINAYTSESDANKLMVWVKHETSHCVYSDFTALEEYKASGLYAHVWNLLEDHRIDELNDYLYEGDKAKSIRNFSEWEKFVRTNSEGKKLHEISTDYLNPLWVWAVSIKEEFYGDMSGIKAAYYKTLSEKGRTHLAALEAGDYGVVLRNISTIEDKHSGTRATGDLARRIMLEVFGAKVESAKGGKGSESGEGEDAGEGDGESASDGESEGDGKGDGEDKDGKGDVPVSVMTAPADPLSPFTPHKEGRRDAPHIKGVKDVSSRTVYMPTPLNKTLVHDFDTGKSANWTDFDGTEYPTVTAAVLKSIGSETGFANKVRTRLQVISRDRWEYGKKRGKLNPSALWRCTMTEARGYNERVFKKQQHNDTLDVAITVLIDCSGSMSGVKFRHAMAAAAMLNTSLGTILNIPIEILGFTELTYKGDSPNTMFIFKGFQSKVGTEEFARRASVADKYLCDNVDGESILFAANRLFTRKEKRRILIVLSDGQPCGGSYKGSTIKHTRETIKKIEASPIELIGVGIMYENVKDYYKKWQKIDDAKDIEHALFTLIDKHIFN